MFRISNVSKADMRHKVIQRNTGEGEVNHLAGSAVGHALLAISCQVEVGGTGTLVAPSR